MTQEQIIEAVEKMTVLELNTRVKTIEEKWGVSAAAVAVAGPAAGGAAADEKSEFDVELTAMVLCWVMVRVSSFWKVMNMPKHAAHIFMLNL